MFKPKDTYWFFKFTIISGFSSPSIPCPKKNQPIKSQISFSDQLQKDFRGFPSRTYKGINIQKYTVLRQGNINKIETQDRWKYEHKYADYGC